MCVFDVYHTLMSTTDTTDNQSQQCVWCAFMNEQLPKGNTAAMEVLYTMTGMDCEGECQDVACPLCLHTRPWVIVSGCRAVPYRPRRLFSANIN